jgi:hypothetical protein
MSGGWLELIDTLLPIPDAESLHFCNKASCVCRRARARPVGPVALFHLAPFAPPVPPAPPATAARPSAAASPRPCGGFGRARGQAAGRPVHHTCASYVPVGRRDRPGRRAACPNPARRSWVWAFGPSTGSFSQAGQPVHATPLWGGGTGRAAGRPARCSGRMKTGISTASSGTRNASLSVTLEPIRV